MPIASNPDSIGPIPSLHASSADPSASPNPPTSSDTAPSVPHHPVFSHFPRWQGIVPEGFLVNFLGVLTRNHYWRPLGWQPPVYPKDLPVHPEYPAFDSQYLEWIALLQSVCAARDRFTMFELGAGFGYWTANAHAALHRLRPIPCTLLAVEAEPTHFQWLREHLADNHIDPASTQLIEAAVAPHDGQIGFHIGQDSHPDNPDAFGQRIGGPHLVSAVTLSSLLAPFSSVDFLHVDIQGAELDVLPSSADELDGKVKRVCVGTHSTAADEALRSLFARLGWHSLFLIPCFSSSHTPWGLISFTDGLQVWLNPSFAHPTLPEAELLRQKLASARREAERLFAELSAARQFCLPPDSIGWRLLQASRRLRSALAPSSSRRRRLLDSLLRRFPS